MRWRRSERWCRPLPCESRSRKSGEITIGVVEALSAHFRECNRSAQKKSGMMEEHDHRYGNGPD